VHDQARRDAIYFIAREHVLTQRHLLDTLGKPLELDRVESPRRALLTGLAEDVLAELPADLAAEFSQPAVDGDHPGYAFATTNNGCALMTVELIEPGGQTWVAVLGIAPIANIEDLDSSDLSRSEAVNELNVSAWGDSTFLLCDGMVAQVFGAAHRAEPGMQAFKRLASHLLADVCATSEQHREEPGPATAYRRLLDIGEASSSDYYTPEELREAALSYRSSLPADLARAVDLRSTDAGVRVTIPFRTRSGTVALSALFAATRGPDTERPGLQVFSEFYDSLEPKHALDWAMALNGDESVGQNDDDDTWRQTTPWSLGSWQLWHLPQEARTLVYRGRVSNTLRPYVRTEDVIRGVIHEVWSSANRYRLHQEFNEAIGGTNGAILQ
jgi:hypothetical protein